MKVKLLFCAVAATVLLCACQSNAEPQNIKEDTPPPEQSEQEVPPSDFNAESETLPSDDSGKEEEESRFPPAPPVCELDFTETESFPLPFEDEVLIDKYRGLRLSTEQALYDYDTMWQLLEENYPFFEAIKRDLGIDWEEVKAEYRQILEGLDEDGYILQGYFLRMIDNCLREFQSVGHLFVVTGDTRLYLLDPWKNIEYAPYQNLFKLLNNPKSELFYEYAKPLPNPNVPSSDSNLKKGELVKLERRTNITEDLLTGYVGGIPFLRIASFSLWDDVAQAKLEDFFSSISQEEHLIIDVRGNGGGSDSGWKSGIVPFLAQQEYEFKRFWAAKSGSLNLSMDPEFDKTRGSITRYTDDSWQKEFPYISPDILADTDIFLKASSHLECADMPDKFHGKIWVLVDEGCYSATEALACFCKETGFATLVGTKTGGNGKGAQPYFMALPYSGLIVEYETYLTFNIDGTCNATSGTIPDIVPEEGRGTLETCLMAIRGELGGA